MKLSDSVWGPPGLVGGEDLSSGVRFPPAPPSFPPVTPGGGNPRLPPARKKSCNTQQME